MKLFIILWLSLVCVEVKSYTSKRREAEALSRPPKAAEGKKRNRNAILTIYTCNIYNYM